MLIVLWLAASVLCGVVAYNKRRGPFLWTFVAIFLSPLLSLLALIAIPAKEVAHAGAR